VMLAAALGPHPLLAGALHDRLAEAGLARASRARGLNIAAGATCIIVLADRGPEAISEAGVTAVLLAARLAVPAAPASLGDPASIDAAVQRLREAGASRLAIAPCVIGPEIDQAELAALALALGAPCSAPLGDHPAIAQLVAVRYGEALARISVASR
jgi:sirohydrochlorin ferrochelatase